MVLRPLSRSRHNRTAATGPTARVSVHPRTVINPNAPVAISAPNPPKRQNLQMSSKVPMIATHMAIDRILRIVRTVYLSYAVAPNLTDTSFDTPGSCMVTP